MRSLNVRLVLFLLVPFVVLLPLGTVLQYYIALVPMRSALDRGLENVALAVAATVHANGDGIVATLPPEDPDRRNPLLIALVDAEGHVITGDPRLAITAPLAKRDDALFFDSGGVEAFHMAIVGVACGDLLCQVRVAEPRRAREYLERDILFGSMAGIVLLLLLIGVAMWFGARDSLAPVHQLRAQLESRSLDDLTPVVLDDPPDELVKVVDAINESFLRIKKAAESNQAFVGSAAHQLRTPLARLTTELEVALHDGRNASSDQGMLTRLKATVDHMSRLVRQLLSLAQSDATLRPVVAFSDVDLQDVVLERGVAWVPRAAELGVDLGFETEPAPVRGNAQLLGEALANLIDNALRYGARHVTARTRVSGDRSELEIEDDGSGVAPEDRERVFQRFVRGSNARADGTGLGLPIVSQIVQLHGGVVTLDGGGHGGLRVRISLPARAATSA